MHKLLLVLREAGEVKRAHNVPHHGEYSVGLHSYNVATIILVLHPNPPLRLIRAALWHDAPERFLGDLPAPAKWFHEGLSAEYKCAEAKVEAKMGINFSDLTDEDWTWLHAADRLELLMWCRDQVAMGNQHVRNVLENVEEWFDRKTVPLEIRRFMNENPKWARGKEHI